jgi:nitrite reductase/ring-hydroxylating ferredoxin subunit
LAPDVPPLALAGVYRREVKASLARVWENVFDWEHLPSLHSGSFAACTLLDSGAWGWRARLVNQPGDETKAQVIELRADRVAGAYRVTTLEGPGAGSEIRTRLTPMTAKSTAIEVAFHVHEADARRLDAIGARYIEVYRRLWDEDEAMMIARARALARRKRKSTASTAPKRLGAIDAVRARAPFVVSFAGERVRIVEVDGALVAYAATCPHWLAPLDDAPVSDGAVVCPWHGYAFDVRSGKSCDGRGLRLAPAPRIVVADGVASLEVQR